MTVYQQITSNKRRSVVLIILFVVFIIALGYTLSYLFDAGPGSVVLAAMFAIIMALVSYYTGDKIALASNHAQGPYTVEQQPELYHLVENLCITAGIPMPKIYIINDAAPNAFATGRDPQHASIAFTTGILQLMSKTELEGVAAHELSHVKNYDTRFMTIVIVCVGLVSLLAHWFWRFGFLGQRRSSRDNGLGMILGIVGLVLLIFSPIISKLIQLAVSRKREFLADASGALLTRYPAGLASALEKLEQGNQPMQRPSDATAHLFITNPFGTQKQSWHNLFSTHPPLAERVQRLRSIA